MALTLTEPNFIDRDPAQVVNDIITRYQDVSGKTLYPAQPERLMIDVMAYREALMRIQFQEAAKQNLIQYASGVILEHHAALFGISRLGALKATTVLRFTADNDSRPAAITIPFGTQIRSTDQKQTFVTLSSVTLELTDTFLDVDAEALQAGSSANDYPAGTIAEPLTTIAFLQSVANTTLTQGGADVETDEQLRFRITQAPETFSVAGSRKSYQFYALSAHPSIIDVAVQSSLPGRVDVYPLTTTGAPTPEIIQDVVDILSDERVRPLTDTVVVTAPEAKTFSIDTDVRWWQHYCSVRRRIAEQWHHRSSQRHHQCPPRWFWHTTYGRSGYDAD